MASNWLPVVSFFIPLKYMLQIHDEIVKSGVHAINQTTLTISSLLLCNYFKSHLEQILQRS